MGAPAPVLIRVPRHLACALASERLTLSPVSARGKGSGSNPARSLGQQCWTTKRSAAGCGWDHLVIPSNQGAKSEPISVSCYAHRVRPRPTVAQRFWAKVDVRGPDECWEWTASLDQHGYGKFGIESGLCERAHRFAWALTRGPIGRGLWVLHSCDRRQCVNPAHLRLGNHADNARDRQGRGRARGSNKFVVVQRRPKPTTVERFWSKVERGSADGCWRWSAKSTGHFGHGSFSVRSAPVPAHRFAWQITRGAIPKGLCVLHRCDVPACVNPSHLFLGTKRDNNLDRDAKGRQASGDRSGSRRHPESRPRGDAHWSRTRPELLARGAQSGQHTHPERTARGERQGLAKLTSQSVRRARRYWADGWTTTDLADEFGTSRSTIYAAVTRLTWAHVA